MSNEELVSHQNTFGYYLPTISVNTSKEKYLKKARAAIERNDERQKEWYNRLIRYGNSKRPQDKLHIAQVYENKRYGLQAEIIALERKIKKAEARMEAYDALSEELEIHPLRLQQSVLEHLNVLYDDGSGSYVSLESMRTAINSFLAKLSIGRLPDQDEAFGKAALEELASKASTLTGCSKYHFDLFNNMMAEINLENTSKPNLSRQRWEEEYERIYLIKNALLHGDAKSARRIVEIDSNNVNKVREDQLQLGKIQAKARSKEVKWLQKTQFEIIFVIVNHTLMFLIVCISALVAGVSTNHLEKKMNNEQLMSHQITHGANLPTVNVNVSIDKYAEKASAALDRNDSVRINWYETLIEKSNARNPRKNSSIASIYEEKRLRLSVKIVSIGKKIEEIKARAQSYQKLMIELQEYPMRLQVTVLDYMNELYDDGSGVHATLEQMRIAIDQYLHKMRYWGYHPQEAGLEESFEKTAIEYLAFQASRLTGGLKEDFDLIENMTKQIKMETESIVDYDRARWNEEHERCYAITAALLYGDAKSARRLYELDTIKVHDLMEKQLKMGKSQMKARSKELIWSGVRPNKRYE